MGCSLFYNAPLHRTYGKMRAEEWLQALFVLLKRIWQQISVAEGQQRCIDALLIQILLSWLHKNRAGQTWFCFNSGTERRTQWEQRDFFHTAGSLEYC